MAHHLNLRQRHFSDSLSDKARNHSTFATNILWKCTLGNPLMAGSLMRHQTQAMRFIKMKRICLHFLRDASPPANGNQAHRMFRFTTRDVLWRE